MKSARALSSSLENNSHRRPIAYHTFDSRTEIIRFSRPKTSKSSRTAVAAGAGDAKNQNRFPSNPPHRRVRTAARVPRTKSVTILTRADDSIILRGRTCRHDNNIIKISRSSRRGGDARPRSVLLSTPPRRAAPTRRWSREGVVATKEWFVPYTHNDDRV